MKKGTVTVFRYNPEIDKKPHYETYEFPFEPGMFILDVATYIREKIDGSFSFYSSCRNSHCGLCGAKINGKPGLMCREFATREMTLEPLDNLSVIRDLIIDRKQYEECMGALRLFLDRVKEPTILPETIGREDLELFKVASRCVECYACVSICPAFQENRHEFWGPACIVQMSRHAVDPRDELNREIIAYSSGVFNCTLCGKCNIVCPHGISPKTYIEMLQTKLKDMGITPEDTPL
jgi:succinate dehydrogenase/fumarate reductase iron-sulfur protein